jgi:hypothetical protein
MDSAPASGPARLLLILAPFLANRADYRAAEATVQYLFRVLHGGAVVGQYFIQFRAHHFDCDWRFLIAADS